MTKPKNEKPKDVTLVPTPATPVAKMSESMQIPEHLRGRKTATESTMRREDLIVPRVKLVQALSPEVEEFGAKPGTFWHNILNEPVGDDEDFNEFDFIAFKSRFFYILFAPRNDPRVVLARADDGVHWRPSSGEFKVKPKGSKTEVTYKMAETVSASGLDQFGSAIPGDPDSQPAATLIYEYLIYMPKHPELGPMVVSLARSQIKKGKVVNSAHNMMNVPMSGLKFKAGVVQEQGAEGPFWNYQFSRAGWSTVEETDQAEAYAEQFKTKSYQAKGESDYAEEGGAGPKDVPENTKKF